MARGSRRQRPATAFGTAAAAALPAFAQRKDVVRGAISAISRKENSYSRLPPDYPPIATREGTQSGAPTYAQSC